jgi:hypothetical protein
VTITVLMLQTRLGDAGATLTAGQSYDLRDDLARELVGLGYAQDTFGVIDNTRDSLADISLSLSSAQLGKLNDAGTPIPKSTLLRDPVTGLIYGQSDGAGSYSALGGGGGGGGGGGADDPTAWGSFTAGKPGTVTVNGVQWVIGYTGDNITSYTVALTGADDLVVAVSYDNGYPEYSGNINIGGAVSMTAAQARYLGAEVLASAGAAANGFRARVTDLFYTTSTANATPIYHSAVIEWAVSRWEPVSNCVFEVWHNSTHINSAVESAALVTVGLPRWLCGAGRVWKTQSSFTSTLGSADILALRFKVNATTVHTVSSSSATTIAAHLEIDTFCDAAASQFYMPTGFAGTGGTGVASLALPTTSVDTASNDITITWTGQHTPAANKTITHRRTRVELLA